MRSHHAFGLAGRAGGVHDIGDCFAVGRRVPIARVRSGERLQVDVDPRHATNLGRGRPHGCHNNPGFAVRDHERLTLKGSAAIERHIGGAAFENGQLGDHEFYRPLERDCRAVARPQAQGPQATSKAVGSGVEFGVGQPRAAVYDSDRLRRPGRLRLDEFVHAFVPRIVRLGRVPRDQHPVALGLVDERQPIDRPRFVGRHRLEQPAEIAEVALDRRPVEQRRRIFELADDAALGLRQAQRQIIDGVRARRADRRRCQAGEIEAALVMVLPGEHRLEYRLIREAARRPRDLHHLFERQVLMGLRLEHPGLDPVQKLADRRSPGEVEPQRQAVDEETDQRLDLDPAAVGHGRADHQVFLAGQSGQKRRPASEYRHEERRPAAQAERLERRREPLVELHRRGRAGVVLPRRTGAIARQVQNRRRARQRAPPVVAVLLEIDSGEPVALPDRVIRILDRQVRQRVDPAFAEGGIERAQLAFQDARRPAVGNDVVQGDEEHMLALRKPDQPPAGQGTAFKIECAEALLDDEPLQRAFGVGLAVEVMLLKRKPEVRGGDPLNRPTVYRRRRWFAAPRAGRRGDPAPASWRRGRGRPAIAARAGCDRLG